MEKKIKTDYHRFMTRYPPAINDPYLSARDRLAALRQWVAGHPQSIPKEKSEVNNHIHTMYSFSPYTPSMAALMAWEAGLGAAGSVDHDSIAAAREMTDACAILGIGGCRGFEVRVSFKAGPFADKKINNPDSPGLAYMTVQGIPDKSIDRAAEFLAPIRERRRERIRAMTNSANVLLRETGINEEIDFERDVLGISRFAQGGSVTERHLLAAAAGTYMGQFGRGSALIERLQSKAGITITPQAAVWLADPDNPHYLFDLLGVLKAEFLSGIFIQPDERECIPADRVTAFARSISAIPAYAYLGDVGISPTGDKRPEKFEDDFLEELFAELSRLGYQAVTYMPPRNSAAQLARVQKLAGEWGLMEISGVDINSSRQSFNCPEVLTPEFSHLIDTTWALIAHERLANEDTRRALFNEQNPLNYMPLKERIAVYAEEGRKRKEPLIKE